MAWQGAYRTLVTRFGAGGDMYGRNGHLGADYDVDPGDPVPAYASGVIGYVALNTRGLGGVVGMKLDQPGPNGEELFAGWAHLDPVNVSVGQRVNPGDTIGHAAGWDGRHGTLWTGPHIHTTVSLNGSSMAAALGIEPFTDPEPIIRNYLTAFAGGATPIGDDMPDVNDLLKAAVPRQDGRGATSLEGVLATWDQRFNELPGRILDEVVVRGGDIPDTLKNTPGSLRGVVAYYDANNMALLRAIASVGVASGLTAEQVGQVVRDALKGSALDKAAIESAVKAALDGAMITLRK